jgi:hypothetical protein
MKVLIAGDSYADWHNEYPTCWATKLKEVSGYDIKNIGISGSSLAYTYKALSLENLDSYDKVIILITNYGRLYVPSINDPKFKNANVIRNHGTQISGYSSVKRYMEKNPQDNRPHLEAVKLYYEMIYDEDAAKVLQTALIKKIQQMIPQNKLILIKCFDHNYSSADSNAEIFDSNLIMYTASVLEHEHICKNVYRDYSEVGAQHFNHLLEANNWQIASYMYSLLQGSKEPFNYDLIVKMNELEFNQCFRKFD